MEIMIVDVVISRSLNKILFDGGLINERRK